MVSKILFAAGILGAIIAVLIFSGKLPVGDSSTKAQGDVLIWGTLPEEEMNNIIQKFNPQAKTYRLNYKEVDANNFSSKLVEALANGNGPDMIIAPHQIILSQSSRLYPFPLSSLSQKNFSDNYVDGAQVFMTSQGAIALPLSIEPMVLFFNRTLFSKNGIANPPVYWDDVVNIVPSLTIKNKNGDILESAISMGTPNTLYSKDILMAIVSQLGQKPVVTTTLKDGTPILNVLANTPIFEGGDILPLTSSVRFFTQFSDVEKNTYTWNQNLGRGDDVFVSEKLAMYIGYSGEYKTLKERNPRANFQMTYLPQTKGYNTFVTGGQIYGIATLKNSKNIVTALTAQSEIASNGVAPYIASLINGNPPFRSYVNTPGLDEVVARSLLVATPWLDKEPVTSINLTAQMISDILNKRVEITDAVASFVVRLQDVYTPR